MVSFIFLYTFFCVCSFWGFFFLDGLVLSIFTVIKNAYGSCYSQHFRISENYLTFENKKIRIYIIFIKFNSPLKGKMDILYDHMAAIPRNLNTIVFEFLECSYLLNSIYFSLKIPCSGWNICGHDSIWPRRNSKSAIRNIRHRIQENPIYHSGKLNTSNTATI